MEGYLPPLEQLRLPIFVYGVAGGLRGEGGRAAEQLGGERGRLEVGEPGKDVREGYRRHDSTLYATVRMRCETEEKCRLAHDLIRVSTVREGVRRTVREDEQVSVLLGRRENRVGTTQALNSPAL